MKKFKVLLTVLSLFVFWEQADASSEVVGVVAQHPSASPDGKQVAFDADFPSPTARARVWIADMDGTNLNMLTTSTTSVEDLQPSWSPLGNRIAFTSHDGTVANIWTINSDGSSLAQLTQKTLNNSQPAWSPDGTKIAFVSDRGASQDIWVMNADGTGQTRLTSLPGDEQHPSFSSDGKSIVLDELISDGISPATSYLMTVNIDGSNLRSITDNKGDDENPSWDSNGIVFASKRAGSGCWKLWTVQADGSGLAQLGDVMTHDPAWTPSGSVLFADTTTGTGALAAISEYTPSTNSKRIVVNQNGFSVGISIRPFIREIAEINPKSHGTIRVAILSTATFDVPKNADVKTIRFGHSGTENSTRKCKSFDANHDGLADLVCRFSITKAGFIPGDEQAILRFSSNSSLDADGIRYQGSAKIFLVDHDDNDDLRDD